MELTESFSIQDISTFQFILAVIGIPLALGFLTEAGKDLYNLVRKKPDIIDFKKMCAEARMNCPSIRDIIGLKETDKFILGRQDKFRDEKLPAIEIQLATILSEVKNLGGSVTEIKNDLKTLDTKMDTNIKG